jgi:hypothetical protein
LQNAHCVSFFFSYSCALFGKKQGVGVPQERALGLRAAATLDVSELRKEFRLLKPHEIEDVLCIFKDELKASAARPVTPNIFELCWCN